MDFTRLAASLGLAALTNAADEDRGVRAHEDEKRARLAAEQERDAALKRATEAEGKLATVESAALDVQVGALIEGAYREGKLLYARDAEGKAQASPREARLRRIAKEPGGLEALKLEIAEMPKIAPVNERVLTDQVPEPVRLGRNPVSDTALASVAAQLGLDVKSVEETATSLGMGRGSQEG